MIPLCVLLLAVSAAGEEGAQAKARAVTSDGARALRHGDPDEAVERFEAAYAMFPESREARRNLALGLSRQGDRLFEAQRGAEALARYERARERHPGRLVYEARRGRALRQVGRIVDALRVATGLNDGAPSFGEGWLLRADVEERQGGLQEAVDALARALRLLDASEALGGRLETLRKRLATEGRFLTHSSGHFIVKYGADVDPASVELAVTLLEDAWSQVTADLGITPNTEAQVVLYTGDEFRDVTDAHGWVGALYGNGTLRVPVKNLERHRDTAARILSHEFTHHVLREATPNLPIWWHEGIAQWAETASSSTDRAYIRISARLPGWRDKDLLFTLAQLRGTRIASVSDRGVVELYYAQTKHFVRWLVDEYGAGALTSFLLALGDGSDTGAAAKSAFGHDEAELLKRWRASL